MTSEGEALTVSDLVDFLLARIAEDEEAARAAQDHPADGPVEVWTPAAGSVYAGSSVVRAGSPRVLPVAEHVDALRARHIARHDPARVLAECEAKRLILTDPAPPDPEDYHGWHITKRSMLRYIAMPYASHPDYRPEWRP